MDVEVLAQTLGDDSVFTNDQIREIEAGKAAGLDVSVYAKPEFLAVHMRSIRLGMEEGFDVSLYAKPEFDWFQMEEIRLGMQQDLDVRIYADPKIDYNKMRILREGLLEGMYLKPFVKYQAGVMRQVFLSKKSGVDISKYVDQGYREAELESIRTALEKDLNIDPFISPDFNGESIKEIATGLERGLDVSLYAFPEYNWEQMRELRRGLEARVDISYYKSHYYHAEQMFEIRIGLESGLDVSSYANLMFTARDMQRKRLAIEEEYERHLLEKELSGDLESAEFEDHVIAISRDEMTATLTFLSDGRRINRESLLTEIRETGIVFGVDMETIGMLADGRFAGTEAVIARGREPKDGKDGYYEYLFELKQKHGPVIRQDGTVDYMDLNNFTMVKKGDRIAYYHNATPGVGGSTVTGRFLKAKNGKEKGILVGKGFIVEEDKKTYVSVMNGRILMQGGKIQITNILELKQVSLVTGSVVYDGDLHVNGDVERGSVIKVSGDVIVDGLVEGATVESGHDIYIRQGISAGNAGKIKAGGSVTTKYIESANIEAEGDIICDYSLDSNLYTHKKLYVKGSNGMLAGGTTQAEEGVDVQNLGNRMGVKTNVEVGQNSRLKEARQKAEKEVQEIQGVLQTLYNANSELAAKFSPESRAKMDIFSKLENAIYTKELELRQKEEVRMELKTRASVIRASKVIVHGKIFEGVKVSIDGVLLKKNGATNYQGVSIGLNGDTFAVTML